LEGLSRIPGVQTFIVRRIPPWGAEKAKPEYLAGWFGPLAIFNLSLKDRLMELYHHRPRATQARRD
jgi:hypothetical protein